MKIETSFRLFRSILFWKWFFFTLLVGAYLYLNLVQFNRSTTIREFPDTRTYLEASASPLFSRSLWGGARPPLVPLISKILHRSPASIRIVQWTTAAVCWVFLGFALAGWVDALIPKVISLAAILYFSLNAKVILWHDVLLSESLCISIMAGLIASWSIFLKRKSRGSFILVMVFSFLSVMARDTNAYILLSISAALGLWLLYRRYWRHQNLNRLYIYLACCYPLLFFGSLASHNVGQRWVFPFYNIMSQRILTQPEAIRFFNERGMPLSAELLTRAHKWGSSDDFFFFNNPALESFRTWVYGQGKRTYINYLIRHPIYFVSEPINDFGKILAARYRNYAATGFHPVIIRKHRRNNQSVSPVPQYLIIMGCILGVGFLSRWNAKEQMAAFLIMMAGSAIIHLFIAWHGDAMEVLRHCLIAAVQFEIALMIAAVKFLDELFLCMSKMFVRAHP